MREEPDRRRWHGEPEALWTVPRPLRPLEFRPDNERERLIRSGVWVDHAPGRRVQETIREFLERPWEPLQRWRGMLFVGDPTSGRSSLLERLLKDMPMSWSQRPVVARMPATPNDSALWSAIAEAQPGFSPPTSGQRAADRRLKAIQYLGDGKLVFEDSDVLADLAWRSARQALARIKSAAEKQRFAVILVVDERVAARISSDKDWGARFEVARLNRWRVDAEFLQLLSSFETALPLQEVSYLAERELALHLWSLCDGVIGRLAAVLTTASLHAIENGTEKISLHLLDMLGFAPPPSFRGFPF